MPELAELVLVKPAPDDLVAVVCLHEERPLDRDRWRELAERHGIADVPVHERRFDDLPFTGSWKVRRKELGRSLSELGAPAGAS
jgi:fatty acid CoA ligase FadD22